MKSEVPTLLYIATYYLVRKYTGNILIQCQTICFYVYFVNQARNCIFVQKVIVAMWVGHLLGYFLAKSDVYTDTQASNRCHKTQFNFIVVR